MLQTDMSPSDHDLLIQLNENVKFMREEVKTANSSTTLRMNELDGRLKVVEALNSQLIAAKQVRASLAGWTKWTIGTLIALAAIFEPMIIGWLVAGK